MKKFLITLLACAAFPTFALGADSSLQIEQMVEESMRKQSTEQHPGDWEGNTIASCEIAGKFAFYAIKCLREEINDLPRVDAVNKDFPRVDAFDNRIFREKICDHLSKKSIPYPHTINNMIFYPQKNHRAVFYLECYLRMTVLLLLG